MRDSRLTLALDAGAVSLPSEGVIAVYRPRADEDLSALPKDRVAIIQGFKPDHDAWAARGYACAPAADGSYAAALVCVPRAKAEGQALIADAVARTNGGPVMIDGQKTDGIDSLYKALRKRGDVTPALSKAHGKFFVFIGAPDACADWVATAAPMVDGFVTAPGVFSADAIDKGSALLIEALPPKLKGSAVDLGAGWGYLSSELLKRDTIREMHLVEAEFAALDCARQNVTDPRAAFHWADVSDFKPKEKFDIVITNPPFHTSRAADPAIGQAFLAAAARIVAPSGQVFVVANRHLPYENHLATLFADVQEIGGNNVFKLLRAVRPSGTRGRR